LFMAYFHKLGKQIFYRKNKKMVKQNLQVSAI